MIPASLSTRRDLRRCLFLYTVGFAVLSLFVFIWFISTGHSLILYADGWNQHLKALAYYGQYLRGIAKNLLIHHQLIIPNWDFTIGEGSDIVATLHYYVIGEPINLLSVFVPLTRTIDLYMGLILLRMYLAGLAFIALCVGTGKKRTIPVLCGVFSYVFCGWAMYNAARHPYFLTPMIYLPLLILGAELIFRRKRPYVFCLSVMLAAVSNFYFFYMLVLLVAVYCALRAFSLYRLNLKEISAAFFRMLVPAVVGVMMAGTLLLPMIFTFLGNSRSTIDFSYALLYDKRYYSNLPAALLGHNGGFWLKTGFTAPALLSIYLLFLQKKQGFLKAVTSVCILIMLIPAFGQVLNGMSYQSNRWSFALGLLSAYLLVTQWDALLHLTRFQFRGLSFCLAIHFFLCCLLESSRYIYAFFGIGVAAIALFTVAPVGERHRWAERLLMLTVVISIIGHSFWLYSPAGDNYISETKLYSTAQREMVSSDATAVKQAAKKDKTVLPRYSNGANALEMRNSGILTGLSCMETYWSLLNSRCIQFADGLSILSYFGQPQSYTGADNRTSLLALSSTDYYAAPIDHAILPYGMKHLDRVDLQQSYTDKKMEQLKEELGTEELTLAQKTILSLRTAQEYDIYKNPNALPIGYCYDSTITKETWDTMNPVERQEAMLQGVYLEEESSLPPVVPEKTVYPIPYEVECGSININYENGRVVTTSNNQTLTLRIRGMKNAETYLYISDLDAHQTFGYDLYFGDEALDPKNLFSKVNWELLDTDTQRQLLTNHIINAPASTFNLEATDSNNHPDTIGLLTKDNAYYSGFNDFSLCFGYDKKPVTSITIKFPYAGVYTFDEMSVQCVPMNGFKEKVQKLRADALTDVKVGTDTLTGRLSLEDDRLLCVTVPYSEGWTAYVDDVETPILPANVKYMGIEVPAGNHDIRLEYTSPYHREGALITLTGFLAFGGMTVLFERQRKRKSR